MTHRIQIDQKKLMKVDALIKESNERIKFRHEGVLGGDVGFTPMNPLNLRTYLSRLADSSVSLRNYSSLDLGSGNGTWCLLTAAFGIPSYGIDVDEYLVEEAYKNKEKAIKRGLVSPDTPLEFAVGNVYPEEYRERYMNFQRYSYARTSGTMPSEFGEDAYKQLGIDIKDMGVIYSYLCEDQLPFLCNFIERESTKFTIYIIPYGVLGGLKSKVKQLSGSHITENAVIRTH